MYKKENRKMDMKLNLQLEGMLTIEATILVPIIFMTLVGILYCSFYLHDMTVARSFMSSSTTEADLCYSLEETLLIGTVEQVKVEEQFRSVKKTVEITFSILFFNIQKKERLTISVAEDDFLEEIRRGKVFRNKEDEGD